MIRKSKPAKKKLNGTALEVFKAMVAIQYTIEKLDLVNEIKVFPKEFKQTTEAYQETLEKVINLIGLGKGTEEATDQLIQMGTVVDTILDGLAKVNESKLPEVSRRIEYIFNKYKD